MNKNLLLLCTFLTSFQLNAQTVLLVNDNDYIVYNTDTIMQSLDNTMYAGYDVWNIPDSGGVYPTATFLANYDVVVWYCSTDGVGLSLWDGTTSGNPELVTYIQSGKPVWIIGQDILYNQYTVGSSFGAGEFAYDYMGLESYDSQSYADDGGLGVQQMDRLTSAPSSFPATITWVFSELWYADGCTAKTSTLEMYEMGPSSYILAGSVSMFHNNSPGYSIMSTFFDPALMNTHSSRVTLLEEGITYLLGVTGTAETPYHVSTRVYPNPVNQFLQIESAEANLTKLRIHNSLGLLVQEQTLNMTQNLQLDLSQLNNGTYILSLENNKGLVAKQHLVVQH